MRAPLAGVAKRTRTIDAAAVEVGEIKSAALLASPTPVIVKDLAAHWPLVRAGRDGADAAIAHILAFDSARTVVGYTGAAAIGGRYHYTPDMTAMNFARERVALVDYLARMRAEPDGGASYYIGSTDLDAYLPGFAAANPSPLDAPVLDACPPIASIWIGNRTVASAHWDQSNNIAVCAVGRRRFTLFPPDQVANLYPGPFDPTPGGQVVSAVDFDAPDFVRHPRFADALAAAEIAEMEPGDVLIYPALWWHQVEALDRFNVLVNYWWNEAPAYLDAPMTTLLHALLSLRDRPASEKAAWRALFDHYVFGPAEQAGAHLPAAARGPLAPLDELGARRLRAMVLQRLNR